MVRLLLTFDLDFWVYQLLFLVQDITLLSQCTKGWPVVVLTNYMELYT